MSPRAPSAVRERVQEKDPFLAGNLMSVEPTQGTNGAPELLLQGPVVLRVGSLGREVRLEVGSSRTHNDSSTNGGSGHHGSGSSAVLTSSSSHMTPTTVKRTYADVVRGGSGTSSLRNQSSDVPPAQVCRNSTQEVRGPMVGMVSACSGAAHVARKSHDLPVLPAVLQPLRGEAPLGSCEGETQEDALSWALLGGDGRITPHCAVLGHGTSPEPSQYSEACGPSSEGPSSIPPTRPIVENDGSQRAEKGNCRGTRFEPEPVRSMCFESRDCSLSSQSGGEIEQSKDYRGRVISGQEPDQIQIAGEIMDLGGTIRTPSVNWLVDTGAEKSFISSKVFDRFLRGKVPLEEVRLRFSAINGSRVEVRGVCHLKISLNGRIYQHRFIIAGIEDEAVLGFDFLEHYKCNWDWDTRSLIIQDQEIPCEIEEGIGRTVKVVAGENRTIPALSEVIIQGLAHHQQAPKYGMVAGQKKFQEHHGLGVARALVKRRGRAVPVRLINLDEQDKYVQKGTEIALFQAVDVLEAARSQS